MPDKQISATGFAGVPCIGLADLGKLNDPGALVFLGCDQEINRGYGLNNPGAASFIRQQSMRYAQQTTLQNAHCYDLGLTDSSNPVDAMLEIVLLSNWIAEAGAIPALIACDHTASMAALHGCYMHYGPEITYVYFDAHFDLGRNCAPDDRVHNGGFVGEMLHQGWIAEAVNIGGRSLCTRLDFPRTPGFTHIPAEGELPETLLHQLAPLAGRTIYVSIDADVLNPVQAPHVACPEEGGILASTLQACCQWLTTHCKVVGIDLCELLPVESSNHAENLLVHCLLALHPRKAVRQSPARQVAA